MVVKMAKEWDLWRVKRAQDEVECKKDLTRAFYEARKLEDSVEIFIESAELEWQNSRTTI